MAHDNSNSEYDACDLVNGWLEENIASTGWRELSRIHDRELRKLVASYETDHLLISISAWTQGNCLDIDVLDKPTRTITMLCVGACAERNEVLARLHSLLEQIRNRDLS